MPQDLMSPNSMSPARKSQIRSLNSSFIVLEAQDKIWRNIRIATMSDAHAENTPVPYGLIENHAIVVRNDKIIAIVKETDLAAILAVNCSHSIVDGGGRLLTPGLIDCHTHLVFGGDRAFEWEQRQNGVSYQQISEQGGGINSTVNATRSASFDQLLAISQQRLSALIEEGVTLLEAKSGYGLSFASEEKQLQVISQLTLDNPIEISATLLAAHTVPPEYRHDPDLYIDEICDNIMPKLWQKSLFEAVDVFCESVGFSVVQTEKLFARAASLGIPVKGHVEQLTNMGGSELVAKYSGLSVDHIEFIDENAIKAIKHSGTVAVLLPGAFYFLRETQKPPIELLRKYKIPLAISTDFNPGTSPFASLRLIMNMACVLFQLTPEEAWFGVTKHAAKALGRSQTHGQIKEGYYADFILWDAKEPVEIIYELGRNPLWQRVWHGLTT